MCDNPRNIHIFDLPSELVMSHYVVIWWQSVIGIKSARQPHLRWIKFCFMRNLTQQFVISRLISHEKTCGNSTRQNRNKTMPLGSYYFF